MYRLNSDWMPQLQVSIYNNRLRVVLAQYVIVFCAMDYVRRLRSGE